MVVSNFALAVITPYTGIDKSRQGEHQTLHPNAHLG